MSHQVIYHPDVLKDDLPKIPRNFQVTIRKAIEQRLLSDPLSYGQPLRRVLQGYRKMRVGDYRVIYKVEKEEIVILKIGHRKEVYGSALPRLRWR